MARQARIESSGRSSTEIRRIRTCDARNRLTAVAASGNLPAVSYTYDSEGHRTAVTQGGQTTQLAVDPTGLSKVLVRTKADGSKTYYVYGHGLLYQEDDAGSTVTYHYDLRGSTVALTDSQNTVLERVEYSVYGQITRRAGTMVDTPFLYNGCFGVQTDPNSLLYMRARYYNACLKRFVNADPSGFGGGLNWYAYADGNPISSLDPFGFCGLDAGGTKDWIQRNIAWPLEEGADSALNFGLGVLFTPSGMPAPRFDPIQNLTEWATGHSAYIPSDFGEQLNQASRDLVPAGQDILFSMGDFGTSKPPSGAPNLRGSNERGQINSRPSGYRAGVENAVWNNATSGPNGGRICIGCGCEVMVPPGTGVPRDWQMDHILSWSLMELPLSNTRKDNIDAYNFVSNLRLLCPPCNNRRGNGYGQPN